MEGRVMSRSERYDALIRDAARNGTTVDRIAEYYMNPGEFGAEAVERSLAVNRAIATSAQLGATKSRSVFDRVVGAVDTLTDYALPVKAAVKAGVNGDYADMAVHVTMPLPIPAPVKLGIVDGEIDMAKATLKQAKEASYGPVVAVADRVNELRKGNIGGAVPEVGATIAIPRDIAVGVKKIAQGDVREGVRIATPAVLTVAGVVEGKLASTNGKGKTSAAVTETPKELPAGAVAEKPVSTKPAGDKPASAGEQVSKSASSEASGAKRPMTQTNPSVDTVDPRRLQNRAEGQQKIADAQVQLQNEMAYQQRMAEAAAHYQRAIVPTLPPPLKAISLETAIDGIAKKGWDYNIAFSRELADARFRKGGGTGQTPAIFRRGDAIVVDWTQLTSEQRNRIYRAAESKPGFSGAKDPTGMGLADTINQIRG
jgi:hypothetical protein